MTGRQPGRQPAERSPTFAKGRQRWGIVIVMACVLLALIGFLLFPTYERQRHYDALRNHGVTTTAHIDYCATATGGRPSVTTVTCPGTFSVNGTTVTEDILGLPRPLPSGAVVRVVVDPRDTGNVYPVSDARSGYQSGWLTENTGYAALSAVLLVAVAASQVVVVRRKRRAIDLGR
jgi:hypothetical protein